MTKIQHRDVPRGPVAKPLSSQCKGPRFNPWSGSYIPHATTKTQSSQKKKKKKDPAQPGFLGGSVVKNPLANTGYMGSIPSPGRSHTPRGS